MSDLLSPKKIYEGTWEEIASHAEDIKRYKRLRLLVLLEDELENGEEELSLAERFKGQFGRLHLPEGETDLSENTGEKFTQIIVEEYDKNISHAV